MIIALLLSLTLLPYHSHPPLTEADEPQDPTGPPTPPCEHWVQVDGGYVCQGAE